MTVRNIKLTLEYDGTNFLGFQRQKRGRTVQAELEKALQRVLQEKVKLIPAGRTDSGVHARGQVISVKTSSRLPVTRFVPALNRVLPKDIAIKRAARVSDDFHARYWAQRKIYRYHILTGAYHSPIERRTTTYCPYALNVTLMRKGAKLLTGTHDFRSFQARAIDDKSTVRTIYRLSISQKGRELFFTVEGNGFLYNMVRNLVGTLLLLGRGKITLSDLRKILSGRDRRLAGPTAPPQGLSLEKVFYPRSGAAPKRRK